MQQRWPTPTTSKTRQWPRSAEAEAEEAQGEPLAETEAVGEDKTPEALRTPEAVVEVEAEVEAVVSLAPVIQQQSKGHVTFIISLASKLGHVQTDIHAQ